MPDYYPKQPLPKAIERGLKRLNDSPDRQRVRMGDRPLERQSEDYSIRVAKASGRKYEPRGQTLGQAIDEDRAASRPTRRSSRAGSRERSSR